VEQKTHELSLLELKKKHEAAMNQMRDEMEAAASIAREEKAESERQCKARVQWITKELSKKFERARVETQHQHQQEIAEMIHREEHNRLVGVMLAERDKACEDLNDARAQVQNLIESNAKAEDRLKETQHLRAAAEEMQGLKAAAEEQRVVNKRITNELKESCRAELENTRSEMLIDVQPQRSFTSVISERNSSFPSLLWQSQKAGIVGEC
jgi:hypothetical protein